MTERATEPRIQFPESLPVSAARMRIMAALESHQVVIVAGATGSGKTTQLPKMCLAAGRGHKGMIAHTQPRRLAARSVAERIADELGVELGELVGFQVRFEDKSSRASRIKVMTDGVLLNAIRHDRNLDAYDTVIVDEAHERTVNIDFLLGYLKNVLRRRSDLRVIVTSATVDAAAFGRYFDSAPVIEVEGRGYPVDIEYAPISPDEDSAEAILRVCNDLAVRPAISDKSLRDILVFLPGEQSIRRTHAVLQRSGPAGFEVLPLYARLNARQQRRVFQPGPAPRIILSTNVAETSLTVPRIRFVIDSGLARVKRYSVRHRIDTLQIEPIAQANATQRAGRCGRIAPGVCIRLYEEEEYLSRPAYTDPEILRTNLAGVLLRVKTLGFGSIDSFPFLDAPNPRFVNDAERLLLVLGAVDEGQRLTGDGRLMARLPVDPRLARLLIEGRRRHCLEECLVVAAALSAGDPREALDRTDATRLAQRHSVGDNRSDFSTLLRLWRDYRQARKGGSKAIRRFCEEQSLAEHRLREWDETHAQLTSVVDGFGWKRSGGDADYPRLHKAILSAFVDYIAEHQEAGSYVGMHGVRSRLFPGSSVLPGSPRWVVAAEHVETQRNFLRMIARIEPAWVTEVAPHLVKRSVGEPRWDARRGFVAARETVSAFGLVISSARWIDYGQVDPERAREIFIRDGLAAGSVGVKLDCLRHNNEQKRLIHDWEARRRSRDLYIGDRGFAAFYLDRLPADVRDRRTLIAWCRDPGNDLSLRIGWRELVTADVSGAIDTDFPLTLECTGQQLALSYLYDPGDEHDGLTLKLPLVLIDLLPETRLAWLVPGHLHDVVLAMLRSLPKELRRPLVPLPETVARVLPGLLNRFGRGSLMHAIAEVVAEDAGVAIPVAAFDRNRIPTYLQCRVELLDAEGHVLGASRDFLELRQRFGGASSPLGALENAATASDTRIHTDWDFDDLPDRIDVDRYATRLSLYPALTPAGRAVRIELLPPGPSSTAMHRLGLRHLLAISLPQQSALLRSRVLGDRELILAYHGVGNSADFADDVIAAAAEAAFEIDVQCRTAAAFQRAREGGRERFVASGEAVLETVTQVLAAWRRARAQLASLREVAPDAVADISAQLDRLVYPGFLAATPALWLPHLPRYLQALLTRCDSLKYRNARDSRDQGLIERAQSRWLKYAQSLPAGWPLPPPVERYRWLTEELRVSLFAQGLGTATAVSGKRLERYWAEHVSQATGVA